VTNGDKCLELGHRHRHLRRDGCFLLGEVMNARVRRGLAVMGLILMAASLSGCIVEGPGRPGGGWCYWHPGACR
jgi:hypothetical protein